MSLDNIRQCAMCRKPFMSLGGKLCGNCLAQVELDFAKIKDYLYDHTGPISVGTLSKETEVPEKTILHLMREGRIEIKGADGTGGLTCEVCHKPISMGSLCDNCKQELAKSLDNRPAAPPPKEEKKPLSTKRDARMHLGRSRKDD